MSMSSAHLALDGAKILNDKYGTPAVLGLPMGKTACCELEKLIRESASTVNHTSAQVNR